MSAKRESIGRTVTVAFLVCLVCSVVVSTAAVSLRPAQIQNALLDKQRNILSIAGLLQPGVSIEEQFANITPRLVDLRSGRFSDEHDALTFDAQRAASDPDLSKRLADGDDIANIRRREHFTTVYMVESSDGGIETLILPIYGAGLWSTLYGFIALEGDLNTIVGLGFYQHAETPGLGGEVDNPNWKQQWEGNLVFDEDGNVATRVVKGGVDRGSPQADYAVDGLAGATLTARGVEDLVRFWMGEQGFRPFLNNLSDGEA